MAAKAARYSSMYPGSTVYRNSVNYLYLSKKRSQIQGTHPVSVTNFVDNIFYYICEQYMLRSNNGVYSNSQSLV